MTEKRRDARRTAGPSFYAMVQSLLGQNKPPQADDAALRVLVMDVTRDGAGLSSEVSSPQPHRVGDPLSVTMVLSDRSTIAAEAEVKWVRGLPGGFGYRLGVSFTRVDHHDRQKLDALLADLDAAMQR